MTTGRLITTRTTCAYCGVGCGIVAATAPDGTVTVKGDPGHPANYGRLCSKGAALAETIGLDGRLLHPEIGGERATWDTALDHVAGYALHNDYSERAFQMERGGQWVKGKSADTFAPLGPFLATRDEIPDPQRLAMWLRVNGESRQQGSTADMIVDAGGLVSYVSQFMTLLPGDIISTGTPAGVALGMKPEPRYLVPGDVVELGIDGLGAQRQRVVG
jgi:hypothetical protein